MIIDKHPDRGGQIGDQAGQAIEIHVDAETGQQVVGPVDQAVVLQTLPQQDKGIIFLGELYYSGDFGREGTDTEQQGEKDAQGDQQASETSGDPGPDASA